MENGEWGLEGKGWKMVVTAVTNGGIDELPPSMERRSHPDLTGFMVRRDRQEDRVDSGAG